MLYNLNNLNMKIASIPAYKDKKNEIIRFFFVDNLIEKLKINEFFITDNDPLIFINEKSFDFICKEAEKEFKVPFSFSDWYEGNRPLLKKEASEEAVLVKINSVADYKKIKEWHSENSSYGKKQNTDQELVKKSKQEKVERIQNIAEQKRKEEREEYNKEANLLNDYNNSTIVAIDMEFKYFAVKQTYMVTEVGITTSKNGIVNSEHYLIEENYKNKYNRTKQDKFQFGETKIISMDKTVEILKERIAQANFLLFHEQREEMEIFKQFNITKDLKNAQVIDTQKSFNKNFKPKGQDKVKMSIEELLETFKIKAVFLHNAGNDARYTLDLLLKMSEIKKVMSNQDTVVNHKKMKMR